MSSDVLLSYAGFRTFRPPSPSSANTSTRAESSLAGSRSEHARRTSISHPRDTPVPRVSSPRTNKTAAAELRQRRLPPGAPPEPGAGTRPSGPGRRAASVGL
eukprot:scaffold19769_cov63-Phaeocystis_antarctica.AAC.2